MSYLFLFREKDSDDRDCCAYINSKNPRFECNHYFSSIDVCGSCYSGSEFPVYEEIETILTKDEYENLKCQFGTSNGSGTENGYGGRRTLPYVFTEQYGTHQGVLSVRESLLKELGTVAIMI